jgi:hypothetical protein
MFDQMSADGGRPINGGQVRFVQIGTQDRGRIRTEVDAMIGHLTTQREATR